MKLSLISLSMIVGLVVACSGGADGTGAITGEGGGGDRAKGGAEGQGRGGEGEGRRADEGGAEPGSGTDATEPSPSPGASPSSDPNGGSASGMKCSTSNGKCWCDDFSTGLPDASCGGTQYSCCVVSTSPTATFCSCSNVSDAECTDWVKALEGSKKASCP